MSQDCNEWVSTRAAACALGVSTDYLYEHREDLFGGQDLWVNLNPTAWRPTYRWNLPRMKAYLNPDVR